MTEKTDEKQSDDKPWQFKPGQSGNPDGRPKGARNAATMAAEVLLDGEAEATRKCVELAKAGDTVALRFCLERILPARKSRSVAFDLPAIDTAADLVRAFAAVVKAMASGEIAPDEGRGGRKTSGRHLRLPGAHHRGCGGKGAIFQYGSVGRSLSGPANDPDLSYAESVSVSLLADVDRLAASR
jgi:hypothetical protein